MKIKYAFTALSMSALGIGALMSSDIVHASPVVNPNFKIIPVEMDSQGTILSYRLNPQHEGNQRTYGQFLAENRLFQRQVYYPDNGLDLPSGFVWYSITPQNQEGNSYLHDLSVMPENRQNKEGHGGDHLSLIHI